MSLIRLKNFHWFPVTRYQSPYHGLKPYRFKIPQSSLPLSLATPIHCVILGSYLKVLVALRV